VDRTISWRTYRPKSRASWDVFSEVDSRLLGLRLVLQTKEAITAFSFVLFILQIDKDKVNDERKLVVNGLAASAFQGFE